MSLNLKKSMYKKHKLVVTSIFSVLYVSQVFSLFHMLFCTENFPMRAVGREGRGGGSKYWECLVKKQKALGTTLIEHKYTEQSNKVNKSYIDG